jgi:hypothetical protein
MSPARLTALAAATAAIAGGVTAVAITNDDNDDHTRTVRITGDADYSGFTGYTGTDLLAKGQKVDFDLAGPGSTVLRGHVERSRSGRISGRVVARP